MKRWIIVLIGLLAILLAVLFIPFPGSDDPEPIREGLSSEWGYAAEVKPELTPVAEFHVGQQQEETPKSKVSSGFKLTFEVYVPTSALDDVVTEELEIGSGTMVQQAVADRVLVGPLKESGVWPEGATIKDIYIKNETITIDFSSEMASIVFPDANQELLVVRSLVNSLLNSSKRIMDVQFLIEGERVERLFGTLETYYPIMRM